MSDHLSNLSAGQLRKAAGIKDRIEELEAQLSAILSGGGAPGKRRGRPSAKRGVSKTKVAKKKSGKRKMSAEGRARIVAAQKKRWAAAKKKKG